MFKGTAHMHLLEILAGGSLKIDEVTLRLARSGKLGFGVEPMDIVSAAVRAGDVSAISDGGKTYLRIPAPFVTLERGCGIYPHPFGNAISFLAYKARNDRGWFDYEQCAIKPEVGMKVEVQWPDRTISVETIDYGNAPPTKERIPGFNIVHRGTTMWLPLDHTGLKVRADAFIV